MRIRQSLLAFVPAVLSLFGGAVAQAQYAPPYAAGPAQYYPGQPGTGYPGGGYPGYGQMPGQGYPPSFQPYPGISPYDNVFQEHANQDGLWFQNSNNGFGPFNHPRDYFFNIDYQWTKTRELKGVVGKPGVQNYFQQNDPNNDGIATGLAATDLFAPVSASAIPDLISNGMRLSGGFWNPDGSGVMMDVSWAPEAQNVYDAGANATSNRLPLSLALGLQASGGRIPQYANLNGQTDRSVLINQVLGTGIPFDAADANTFGPFGSTLDILDRSLLNLHGIGIDNGSPFGVTVPYDLEFVLKHEVQTLGAAAAFAFRPVYDHDGIRINPIVGGRYFRIDETFSFNGLDSGLAYGTGDADVPLNAKILGIRDGRDDDNDFIVDNASENNALTPIQINPFDPILVRSHLISSAVSDLAGPEFGVNYNLGNKKGISITGATKVGAMINVERLRVSGDNIGDHMGVDLVTGVDPVTGLFTATDMNDTNNEFGPSANAFSSSMNTTHFSPMFTQSLTAEIPLFRQVPILRDVWQLEEAKLRVGWSFLMIAQVADPNQSVNWTSKPNENRFPSADSHRGTFFQNSFNVGLNWDY